ncbi:MAG: alkaline phosphatase [Bacteroidaceae bacterium]|nr:alkaline phosphatase [Bacteroidaceae bacterium]
MKRILGTLLLLLVATTGFAQPKYIFYFIGDGMGPSHVLATELYLGELQGVIGRPQKLVFTQFPESAFVTTFSASNGVTDSAASGTALSTGYKTSNGRIGTDADGNDIYSVAYDAKNAGMAVGIATTVCINHATPSAFYAHNNSRNNYNEIAQWMLEADYDFYAGGDAKCTTEQRNDLYGRAEKQGYTIARGYDDYKSKAKKAEKMMLYQKNVAEEVPYAIDRTKDDLTLAQITKAGIDFLSKKSKKEGFFMMVEGGKIDYASHRDDAATMIHEVLDFNAAIEEAYEFYKMHKNETLIIVTADHETGGIVLGYTGQYKLDLKVLESQKVSVDNLVAMLESLKKTTWGKVSEMVKENIGVEPRGNYSNDEAVEMTHDLANRIAYDAIYDLNHKALISWASGNHSGTFVPLFAIGEGADRFNGVIDNTDIPLTIMEFLGIDTKLKGQYCGKKK